VKESTGGLIEEGSSRSLQAQAWRASLEKKHLAISEKSSRRRNRRSGFTEETSEVPSAVRSQEVAQGLSLASREGVPESSGLGSSENRGFCGRETLVERNRDPRFPERISAVDLR
jgi:hypothetical protein